ncbi:hypothetical protein AAC387_Pa02g4583 [Persea americana]
MMEEVKLYGAFPSAFSCRVEWALIYKGNKGITYEYIEEDLQNNSPSLLKYNPVHKQIPVLLHGGKPIAESLVILEYIDETRKENPLLPQDPCKRAKARSWAKFAEEKKEKREREKAVKSALEAMKTLDEELKGKEFFWGERVGFVDLVVGWIPYGMPVLEEAGGFKLLDADAFPFLHVWGERILNVPFIKVKLPPSDRMLAYAANIQLKVIT